MQKHAKLLIVLASVALTGIMSFSCSSPTANPPETVKYTVTFDAKGGDPAPAAQTVEAGKKATRPEINPTKDGLVFGGWFTDSGYAHEFDTSVLKNTTLTAKWQCAITFSPGEGSFDAGTATTKVMYVEPDAPITAPIVTRVGWNLAGWTLDASAATPVIYALQDGAAQSISLTAVWTKLLVVEFNSNGATSSTSYPTQYLLPGDKITEPTTKPVKDGYVFRFWSANGTTEYDFTPSITDNVALTAVYGLDISSVYVTSYNKEITVYLSKGAKESALGEITFTASINSGATIPVTATLKEFSETSYSASADYTFSQIAPSSMDTDLNIVITAHTSAAVKSATAIKIPRLVEVTGFTAVAEEKLVKLTWTYVSSKYAGYKITYTDHLGVTQVISDISPYTTQRTITGLQDNHEYTFTLSAIDNNSTWTPGVSITATPKITKATTDWLFIQYMDGDNNLNDNLWVDINEMETGLYRNTSGMAVKAVVLWDGWAGNATETPTKGSPSTRILELGKDTDSYVDSTLSESTKDLSYTAPWLASGEVDMSSRQTLENFLAWVTERYDATNVVLGFSNHGGGPRFAAQTIKLPDGRVVSMPSDRAMCWDESAGNTTFLSTKDVSKALLNSGYGTTNKLGMILLDVCLGGSVEEAYEYRDYADYFVASPNNIPGTGLDYYDVIRQLSTSDTIATMGKRMVYDYYSDYQLSTTAWNSILAEYAPLGFTSDNVDLYYAGRTLSLVNLANMDSLKTAIDGLASVLLGTGGATAFTGLTDKNNNPLAITYREAMKELWMRPASPMNYMGSFTWLFDIGSVADGMAYCSAPTIKGTANANAWAELYAAANGVTAALQAAVAYAWRDGYYYTPVYGNTGSATPGIGAGLSICGETVAYTSSGGTKTLIPGVFPDFYTTDNLSFAASPWATLLDTWF